MKTYYIKDEGQLKQFCEHAQDVGTFSIDTEFQRRDTYYAIPALVQIAFHQDGIMQAACIDPKTIRDWSALEKLLNSALNCIMHSSGQDLEIFDRIFPNWEFSIRDTQLACALLGAQPQLGYAGLIKQELGIEIDKSQTRTNWLQRPLTQKQLDYALSDVTHLLDAWNKLEVSLHTRERMDWFLEDCGRLRSTHEQLKDNTLAWKKLKGIRNLDQQTFARAASLAEWREYEAQHRDRPRRWLLEDEIILELCENPQRLPEFAKQWKLLDEHYDVIQEKLENLESKYTGVTEYASLPLNVTEKKRYQLIKSYSNEQAARLAIEPNTLSNRKTLEKIARGQTDFLQMSNWRHRIFLDFLDKQVLM